MPSDFSYTATDLHYSLPARSYIALYRDPGRFMACCRQCPAYGRTWGCPPFDHDIDAELSRYTWVSIIATRIIPADTTLPLSAVQQLIRPERLRLERRLLELEARRGGRAFAYIGECLYCPPGTCTRPQGQPCRHPELVRPSLEAYGFDISRTLSELFGESLVWSSDGRIPPRLVLVTAHFS